MDIIRTDELFVSAYRKTRDIMATLRDKYTLLGGVCDSNAAEAQALRDAIAAYKKAYGTSAAYTAKDTLFAWIEKR